MIATCTNFNPSCSVIPEAEFIALQDYLIKM